MDLEQLLQQAENLSALSDEELASLLDDLRAAADGALADPSDEDLATLERVAVAVETIEAEQGARATADAERAERARGIAERIRGDQSDPDPEAEAEAEAEAAPAAPATPEAGDEAAPIAASGRPAPRISRVAVRRPASVAPRADRVRHAPVGLVAAANLPDVPAGTPLDSPAAMGAALIAAFRASRGYRGPRVKIPVARLGGEDAASLYGEERTLRRDYQANAARIEAVTSTDALAASGGICAPPEVRYDLPVLMGTDARPVRDDMMTRFGADRGGVATLPPPVLADVTTGDTGAIATWTATNDETPAAPATKPCLTVTCPAEEVTEVDAITRCLEFGNFRARFFGEQVRAWVDLAAVQFARYAETKLLTAIGDGSTQITATDQLLDTVRDVLPALIRASSAIRSRHRLADSFPLRWGAPRWLRDQIRAGLAREMSGGSTAENLAVADATINGWFAALNLNVTWFLDGETGQVFGAQADGDLLGWPATAVTYLFPEGTWLFLDGGEQDFGIVRDTVTNATNDFQMFYEAFEAPHFHGVESYRLPLTLCPTGGVSGTVDVTCLTGL